VKQREAMFSYILVPIILYSGVIIDSIIFMLQVIMDFIKSDPNSDCETCLKFSHSENELVDIKEEGDPLSMFRAVKPENEVMLCFLFHGDMHEYLVSLGHQSICTRVCSCMVNWICKLSFNLHARVHQQN
jgi:hypothetical protein